MMFAISQVSFGIWVADFFGHRDSFHFSALLFCVVVWQSMFMYVIGSHRLNVFVLILLIIRFQPLECRLPSRTCCLPSCRGQAIRHGMWLSSAFSLSQRWIYFHWQIWWRQGLLPNSGMFFAPHSTSRLERRSRGNMTFHAKPSLLDTLKRSLK